MSDLSKPPPPISDYNHHLDRAEAEHRLARNAWSAAAHDAHHQLALLHEAAARDHWHEHVLLSPDDMPPHPTPAQQIQMVSGVLHSTYG